VLPSLFILIALSWVYIAFGEMPLVAGLFYGIKPAVTAIVVQAAHRIGGGRSRTRPCGRLPRVFRGHLCAGYPVPGHRRGAALIGYVGGGLHQKSSRPVAATARPTDPSAEPDRRRYADAGAPASAGAG
jgi:chromate transporter